MPIDSVIITLTPRIFQDITRKSQHFKAIQVSRSKMAHSFHVTIKNYSFRGHLIGNELGVISWGNAISIVSEKIQYCILRITF
jgi:hypothetical protein